MQFVLTLLIAAAVFGICHLLDKGFTKAFRNKAQHHSGKAVRLNKRYGVFGIILTALGIIAICVGVTDGPVLLVGGIIVLLMGLGLGIYYLSFGIFYDADTFLISRFGKGDTAYTYDAIQGQKLYLLQGGNIIVELHMMDGNTVSLQANMEGVYPFLDAAFAAWCRQTEQEPESCEFHDPSQSLWFPTVEDT